MPVGYYPVCGMNTSRQQALVLFVAGLSAIAAGTVYLGPMDGAGLWLRAVIAAAVLAAITALLWFNLDANHPVGQPEALFTGLGPGNTVSVLRGLLLALLAGLIPPFANGTWSQAQAAATCLVVVFMLLDLADGWLARRTNRVSLLGERLDIEMDSAGLFVVALLGALWHLLPPWYLGVALLRPLFVAGQALRVRNGLTNHPWPASDSRRRAAAWQSILMVGAVWPGTDRQLIELGAWIAALLVAASFGRDWLWMTGAWTDNGTFNRRWQRFRYAVRSWLPVSLRPVTVLGGITMLAEPAVPLEGLPAQALAAVAGVSLLAILTGAGLRTGSAVLVCITGLLSIWLPFNASMGLAVGGGMLLFIEGCHQYVLRIPWLKTDPPPNDPRPRRMRPTPNRGRANPGNQHPGRLP